MMKKIVVSVIAVFVSLFFLSGDAFTKDKAAKKPKVVKECKKDGTRCTADELKDKKLKRECKNPCREEEKSPDAPSEGGEPLPPPPGQ